jgi:membrane protein DedA with SNARE-associated domain
MIQMTQFLIAHGGLFLFLVVLAEQSGLPCPAAPWLLAAGALAATGRMSLFAAISWTATGSLAADATWFYIGHRGKGWVLKLFPRLSAVRHAAAQKTSVRSIIRGMRILSTAKFLPFGTIVPLRAGALNVSSWRFVLLDAISSTFYASMYVLLGFFFHEQLEQLVSLIRRLGLLSLALVVILVAVYLSYRFLKRRRPKLNNAIQSVPKLEETHV